jgi:thymidylate kinase
MAMETYRTWVRLFELLRYYSWIVDRFHISTNIYQARFGRKYDFRWLEERMLPLGFCIIFCTRTTDSFKGAREERLKISGKPEQYKDLNLFIREQEEFRKAVSDSILPSFEVDVSHNNIDLVCDKIADILEENELLGFRNASGKSTGQSPIIR